MYGISRSWVWVIVILFIIVLGFVLSFGLLHKTSIPTPYPAPALAPQGQVVSGFPQDLLIDSGAQITNSYSLQNGSLTTYAVEWNSSSTPQSLLAGYELYFGANGWNVTGESTSSVPLSIYAGKNGDSVNVAISPRFQGSAVVMGYLPSTATSSAVALKFPPGFPFVALFPGGDSTLIASQGNASSGVVVFSKPDSVSSITAYMQSSLQKAGWKIINHNSAKNSATISASGPSGMDALINIAPISSGMMTVTIHYYPTP